jgi:hypothetical protein
MPPIIRDFNVEKRKRVLSEELKDIISLKTCFFLAFFNI